MKNFRKSFRGLMAVLVAVLTLYAKYVASDAYDEDRQAAEVEVIEEPTDSAEETSSDDSDKGFVVDDTVEIVEIEVPEAEPEVIPEPVIESEPEQEVVYSEPEVIPEPEQPVYHEEIIEEVVNVQTRSSEPESASEPEGTYVAEVPTPAIEEPEIEGEVLGDIVEVPATGDLLYVYIVTTFVGLILLNKVRKMIF